MYFNSLHGMIMATRFFHTADITELEEALTHDEREPDAKGASPPRTPRATRHSARVIPLRNRFGKSKSRSSARDFGERGAGTREPVTK